MPATGLPNTYVWVATLAESRPETVEAVEDPSESAVDRFLKWETDSMRRLTALRGALPRRLDREVLERVAGPEADFVWLCRLPFVVAHTDGYRYHDVVRAPMLRSLRRASLLDWQNLHATLAEYYESQRADLKAAKGAGWNDARLRDLRLEECYHRLCSRGSSELPVALHGLIDAYGRTPDSVVRWAQMVSQAGEDAGFLDVRERGRRLVELITDDPNDEIVLLTSLANDPSLDSAHRGSALAERSQVHERLSRYDKALEDLERADALHPATPWILGWRGSVYWSMGRHVEALADFDRTVELDPNYKWAIASRGLTYRSMERYTEALADFDRAIELDPNYEWAIANRGETYRSMERHAEALTDFDRAIELDPNYKWAIASRGLTYRSMERYTEALADYDRAIELDPNYGWAIAGRAETYRLMQ